MRSGLVEDDADLLEAGLSCVSTAVSEGEVKGHSACVHGSGWDPLDITIKPRLLSMEPDIWNQNYLLFRAFCVIMGVSSLKCGIALFGHLHQPTFQWAQTYAWAFVFPALISITCILLYRLAVSKLRLCIGWSYVLMLISAASVGFTCVFLGAMMAEWQSALFYVGPFLAPALTFSFIVYSSQPWRPFLGRTIFVFLSVILVLGFGLVVLILWNLQPLDVSFISLWYLGTAAGGCLQAREIQRLLKGIGDHRPFRSDETLRLAAHLYFR
eukprot:Protomagalhaensia_sp_Gyna_25__854@NODE_1413_length_1860_cov_6_358045_g1140_i0_p1_GENE_NODE_1413_length_1860_cov_6_358045_g1140_i0NODE_1413_length_1860_cov_6_358045_g1140_i0_p1_ORF_typecomplete_len269_score40_51_NODE_1413_length_1860_cov_6_358045_g1140_i09991805